MTIFHLNFHAINFNIATFICPFIILFPTINIIEVVNGKAPEAFEGLEAPTHAFIGGSSGSLKEMLDVLSGAPGSVRVVINAVSLETMAEIQSILSEYAITDLSIEQISVTRSRELGKYHLMTAENPVIIAAFTLGERE